MKREKLDPSAKMYGCVLEGGLAEFIQAQAIEHGLSMREVNHDAFEMYRKNVEERGEYGPNTLKAIETKDEREAAAVAKAAERETKKAERETKKAEREAKKAAKAAERETKKAERQAAAEAKKAAKAEAAASKNTVATESLNPAAKRALEKQASKKGKKTSAVANGKVKLEAYSLSTAAGLCGVKVAELKTMAKAGEILIEKDEADGSLTMKLPAEIPVTMKDTEILQIAKDIAATAAKATEAEG